MIDLKIISHPSEIKLSKEWVDSPEFEQLDSRDKIVDKNGKGAYGRLGIQKYEIIAQKERQYPLLERIGRVVLGLFLAVWSLLTAFCFQKVRDLFFKNKEVVRFAVPYEPTVEPAITADKVTSIVLEDGCAQSSPCQHVCVVNFTDKTFGKRRLDGYDIQKLIETAPEKVYLNSFTKEHFAGYKC